jgi:hypothetical protein
MSDPSAVRPAHLPARATRPLHERLVDLLGAVRYPAERWEIVAEAATRGADRATAYRLARLPYRTFHDLDSVLDAALAGVYDAQGSVPRPGHVDPG